MNPSTLAAATLAAILGASQAQADFEQGKVVVRIGAGRANPGDDSNWLRLGGVSLPNTRVYVDDGGSATLTGTWLIFDHRGLGLLAPIPYELNSKVNGLPGPVRRPTGGRVDLGSVKQLPATVTVQWLPVSSKTWIQPYFAGTLGAAGEADLDPGSSWGLAGELGVDLSLGRDGRWQVNAAVWYLHSDVEIRIPTYSGTRRIKGEVDTDPWTYSVGVGYRF